MRTDLLKRCELFIQNRDIIKSELPFETAYLYPLCAGLCAAKGVLADAGKMKMCRDLLKQKTGLFSSFRGISKMATITSLSLSGNPDDTFERMLYVYSKLKELFWGSDYLTVAASAIADLAAPAEYDTIVLHTRTIYNRMKAAHPFLTSGEDSAFAALLALSGLDDEAIELEMERCYSILKPDFWSGNAVQSLSHVLALGDETAEEKCRKTTDLFLYLKNHGYKYGTSYELSTLGALALINTDIASLAEDIMETDNYLKAQKGFGAFGVGSKQRLMYAGMLVMCDYIPSVQTIQVAALNGIVSLIIAQQAAICASMAAASAAAASSSST